MNILDGSQKRNPPWSKDELILALDLYLKHRKSPPGKNSPEIIELSELLNKMSNALGLSEMEKFRNPNGVYMKLMNFRSCDPEYTKSGKVGLTRGNKDEEVVWNEFAPDPERLSLTAAAIRFAIEKPADDLDLLGPEEPEIQEAQEGRVLTRLHRFRERDRKLVESKKQEALKKHGRLSCEVCGFDFSFRYGPSGNGIIDVHHTIPVHTLAQGQKTRLEDLSLLCANCHRMVRSSRRWLSLEELRSLICI